jgi:hypothetical protein
MAVAAGVTTAVGTEGLADASVEQEQEQQESEQIPATDVVGGEDAQAPAPPSAGS